MDILIDNTMSKLENATIYDNSDTSNIKFEPKVPSSIDVSTSSNWNNDSMRNKDRNFSFTFS